MPRKKSKPISRRQQQILDYIKQETETQGYPPSVREIGRAVGLKSTSTVHGHLSQLEKKGYIRRDQVNLEQLVLPAAEFPAQRFSGRASGGPGNRRSSCACC